MKTSIQDYRARILDVKGHQTSDGKFFGNIKEAIAHEKELAFREWYGDHSYDSDNQLNGEDCRPVNWKAVYNWIQEHQAAMFNLLV